MTGQALQRGIGPGEMQHAGAALAPMTEQEIHNQVQMIQRLMRSVMKKDVHYGQIPGTNSNSLYKPGAEKLGLTFRLAPSFDIKQVDLPGEHREYTVTSRLTTPNGVVVAEGIGVCSTMESKYRYRWDATGRPVPQDYWTDRDPEKLGGTEFAPRKVKGKWMIFQKIDHTDPADYYNTCAKMAKKRAHVDVILTATAASDIFDQDLEDLVEAGAPINESAGDRSTGPRPPQQEVAPEDAKKRDDLILQLEEVATNGEDALLKVWQDMPENERKLIGAEFGRIKRLAAKEG